MNKFVSKAVQKIDQLDTKQIIRIIKDLDGDVKMLQVVLDSMRDGVILCKQNADIVYANARTSQLLPFFRVPKGRDVEGMPLSSVLSDTELLDAITRERSSGTEGREQEFNYQRGDGVRTISMQVVKNDALIDNSFLVIISDVTEKNLNAAKLHQSEYLSSMTTMAASVAHEIKNPLAAMSIHVQLMRRHLKKKGSMTEDEAGHYLDVLEEEIGRLNSIAVDFLFAVRPMNTSLKLQEITPAILQVVDFVRPEMEQHHVKVNLSLDCPVTRINYDDKLLTQVMLNLMKNAMNAMPDGGTLTVSLELDGDNVALKISDTGVGIPEENLSKIFEPYFTTKSDGTGLGLTIVYKVMKEHGGEVSVQSKVGEGTTFTLSFPVPMSERLSLPKTDVNIESLEVEVKE